MYVPRTAYRPERQEFDFLVFAVAHRCASRRRLHDPLLQQLQFIAPKATADFKPDADYLKGKVIGAQRATLAGTYLEDKLPDTTAKLYDTQENAYLDLTSGRVDGILADKYVQYEWLKSKDGSAYEFKRPCGRKRQIVIADVKHPLRERLNEALQRSRQTHLQEDPTSLPVHPR